MTSAQTGRRTRPGGGTLWRHRDFRRLWAGQAISQVGTQVSILAIPVIAVQLLHAGPIQMGVLNASETLAFLVIGLPAGAWVDRWRKRRVMMRNDLFRALALLTLPLAWLLGGLTFVQLVVVSVVVGACTVFFDVAYQSYLPTMVSGGQLVEGNGKLSSTENAARMAGPALAGGLLQLLAGPLVILIDAISYLFSAAFLRSIGQPDPIPSRDGRRPLRTEIAEGLQFVIRHPLLVRITACTSLSNLANGIFSALEVLFLLKVLRLPTGTLGLVFSAGAVGGLLGAVMSGRVSHLVGEGRIIPLSAVVGSIGLVATPAAALLPTQLWQIVLLITSQAVFSAGVVTYNVTQVSFRQRLCPPRLLGRMNASVRFLVWGVVPIGGLLGGLLGELIGVTATLWLAVVGQALAAIPTLASPLIGMRELPSELDAHADPS